MTNRQTSMQLTPATEAQVEWLKAQGHGPQFTDLVRVAIDRMAREEGMNMKADIKSIRIDSKNSRLELRAGEKGTGKVLKTVLYWPDSPRSEEEAYRILTDEAARIGAELTQHDPDKD